MNPIQEAETILRTFQQNPSGHAAILGVKDGAKRAEIYARYSLLLQQLKPINPTLEEQTTIIQATKIVTRAKDSLLSAIMEKNAKSSTRKFVFYIAACTLIIVWGYLLYSIHSEITVVNLLVSLVIGYFLADFISGVLHVLLDKFIAYTNPLLGEMAQDFEWHHEDPSAINKKTIRELVEPILVYGALPVGLLALFVQGYPWAVLIIFFICAFDIFSQLIHKWAHLQTPPNRMIKFLQDTHLILPPISHAQHHLFDADQNFCLLTGHFNPFFNFLMRKLDRFTLKKKF